MVRPINAFLAAVCVSLAIALTVVLISPPQRVPSQNYNQSIGVENEDGSRRPIPANPNLEKSDQHGKHEARWYNIFERPAEGWIALFNGLLVIVTGWLVLATIWLWKAGEKQIGVAQEAVKAAARSAEIAERALIFSERAFVFLKKVYAASVTKDDTVIAWEIQLVWENSGSTPTQNLFMYKSWDVFPGGLPDDFDFPDHVKQGTKKETPLTFIGPKSQKKPTAAYIPVETWKKIQAGPDRFYMWGWAEYSDIFSEHQRYRSEFCFEVVVKRNIDGEEQAPFDFVLYKKHNGSGKECFRLPNAEIPIYHYIDD